MKNLPHGSGPATLVDLLRSKAERDPGRLAYTFLLDGESQEAHLTYRELDEQARAAAALLQTAEAGGTRIILLYPPGLQFISAFFGCLYAGAIAVPTYPPDIARFKRSLPRFQAIVRDSRPSTLLTLSSLLPTIKQAAQAIPELKGLALIATDEIDSREASAWRETRIWPEAVAFLQYTSGSTSDPKGVMVSHANILNNERMIEAACGHTKRSTFVGWLPLYHDMGLIGNVLQPLHIGARCILMSPVAFLEKPVRWLRAITRYEAATSGGPNFAYDLCVRKVSLEERETLDLSSWTTAFNGAEPIRAETIERFSAAFEPCGFRRNAFFPCYGMAETTLIVTGARNETGPAVKHLDSDAIAQGNVVDGAAAGAVKRALVGSGKVLLDQEVIIVNPQSHEPCSADRMGEIWTSGPSVARGYWNRPEETSQSFGAYLAGGKRGPFFRTGDLGFFSNGELFVTGRLKDLIIVRGCNHFPHDIELTVEKSHPALRPGCGAAVSVDVDGEEKLVIVQEVARGAGINHDDVIDTILRAVSRDHDLRPHAVALIEPGTIPKTSSGKIQRYACREAFIKGSLEAAAQWQERQFEENLTAAAGYPRGDQEETRARLISQVAQILRVPPSDMDVSRPLIDYGLDSLMAAQVAASVESCAGFRIPTGLVLQGASIEELCSEVTVATPPVSAKEARSVALDLEAAYEEHPLSYNQKALWILHSFAPESSAYNIARAARIHSALDVAALRRCLQQLVDRHSALRTQFAFNGNGPVQRVHRNSTVWLKEVDVSGWTDERLKKTLSEQGSQPFDLVAGPLFKAFLYSSSDRRNVLLLCVHHIVADLWSLSIFLRELAEIYRAETEGGPPKLNPVDFRYSDYVEWQAGMLAGAEAERLLDYWKRQLDCNQPLLDLKTDRPRPMVQTYQGARHSFTIDSELTLKLRKLSNTAGATLFVTLLASFHVLLSRLTGEKEPIVGSPVAGRTRANFNSVIGYFVNTVALRADLTDNPSFDEFLARTKQTVIEAIDHQDYPFALLVERLQPHRDASRSPIFQVMFAWQQINAPEENFGDFALGRNGNELDLGALRLESFAVEDNSSQFDLTLMMTEDREDLAASFQYNSELFEPDSIANFAACFIRLLEGAAASPHSPVAHLPLMNESERHRVLVEWNETNEEYERDRLIHEMIERQAERKPDSIAVVFDDQRITYSALNRRSNQAARFLSRCGVGAETRVGLMMSRGPELVMWMIAILKAGGAYVAIDPAYPRQRREMMIGDSGMEVMVTDQPRDWAAAVRKIVAVDEIRDEVETETAEPVEKGGEANNLAYVIYTSGSSGKPKGVGLEHRGVVGLMKWAEQAYSEEEIDGVLAATSICFDLSVFEILVTLGNGGKVIVVGSGLEMTEEMERGEVRLINTVPSLIEEVVRGREIASSVRVVNLAGEALRRELVEKVYETGHVERVVNLYGPTEDTTYTTVGEERRGDETKVTIGRPIGNTKIYILDNQGEAAPIRTAGEIYIASESLGRGYIGRADMTAERFVPDQWSGEAGRRAYRTGDIGSYRADGKIEYLGRKDHQVKVRGYRIELEEIETVLCRHDHVRDAKVIVTEHAPGENRIAAYVVLKSDRAGANDLDSFLRESLPGFMIPGSFTMLDSIPLTPNGKVDRRALPDPRSASASGVDMIAPRDAVERALAKIWQDVLQVEGVGIHNNFFDLGGHSLLLARVHREIQNQLNKRIPITDLLRYPTISSLAGFLAGAKREATAAGERSRAEGRKHSMRRQREIRKGLREAKEA